MYRSVSPLHSYDDFLSGRLAKEYPKNFPSFRCRLAERETQRLEASQLAEASRSESINRKQELRRTNQRQLDILTLMPASKFYVIGWRFWRENLTRIFPVVRPRREVPEREAADCGIKDTGPVEGIQCQAEAVGDQGGRQASECCSCHSVSGK